MSVLDEFRGLETRVAKRLGELRPMVEEYRELEQVARRLGLDNGDTRPAHAVGASKPSQRSARGRRRASATSGRSDAARGVQGGRQQQVAELVQRRPGITVRELGAELGADPTSLYRIVRRLEREGTIQKDGRHLRPV